VKKLSLAPLIAIGLFFCCFPKLVVAGNENRAFESQRLLIIERIESILIASGLCKSRADCQQKKLYFVSPATHGLNIKTYSVHEPEILARIVAESSVVYYEMQGVMEVSIENYSVTKQEELASGLFKIIRPVRKVEFKGGNDVKR
jgi:hypothetical protein